MALTEDRLKDFLERDLYDALRWLFEGAIVWQAGHSNAKCRHQFALGLFMNLVQARALYEFVYSPFTALGSLKDGDTANAHHFAPFWSPPSSVLYTTYMANRTPAQKRVFHLVYTREAYSGATDPSGTNQLNTKALDFAKDLLQLMQEFAAHADSQYVSLIQGAIQKALAEADLAASHFGIPNPLR